MKIKFIQQIPIEGNSIEYAFNEDKDVINVKVVYQDKVYQDTFDFSSFSNGELEMYDENGEEAVQTNLPIQVLLGAKRTLGKLEVELLEWVTVEEEVESDG